MNLGIVGVLVSLSPIPTIPSHVIALTLWSETNNVDVNSR